MSFQLTKDYPIFNAYSLHPCSSIFFTIYSVNEKDNKIAKKKHTNKEKYLLCYFKVLLYIFINESSESLLQTEHLF